MYLATLTTPQKETLICLAHNIVVSDGEIAPGEAEMMAAMRDEMSLADDVEARYLPLEGVADTFDSLRARTIAIIALVRLSYADGAFEIEERCYLDDLRREFGISDARFDDIQAWVRRLVALNHDLDTLLT